MASVKLSPALKNLINASHAQGAALPAPSRSAVTRTFERLATSATAHGLGEVTWLTLGSAALVTLNSPATLCELHSFATTRLKLQGAESTKRSAEIAAIMREAGLKTISFSGIPRAINNLGSLRAHLDPDVVAALSTTSTRQPTPITLPSVEASASTLWNSIYAPHSEKLLKKLADSHPDLPVHILSSHYGPLLADPFGVAPPGHAKVGRVLTSVVAIACLRAQGGVGPQVTSHVFGLRKAGEEPPSGAGEELQGREWLTSEEGATWVLEQVDQLVQLVSAGRGPSFATRAKL